MFVLLRKIIFFPQMPQVMAKEKEKGFNWVIIYRGWGAEILGRPADFMYLCSAAFLETSGYLIPPPDALSPAPPGQKDKGRKGGGGLSPPTETQIPIRFSTHTHEHFWYTNLHTYKDKCDSNTELALSVKGVLKLASCCSENVSVTCIFKPDTWALQKLLHNIYWRKCW